MVFGLELCHRICYTVSGKNTMEVEDGIIRKVEVKGGCSGNLQGISRLLVGMPVQQAIERMEGVRCGLKPTSCPDQLAQALKQAL